MRPHGALYSVPISVEGGPEGQALLDLGNGAPLLLSREYAEAHGVLEDRRTSTGLAGGVGGMLAQRALTLKSDSIETAVRASTTKIAEELLGTPEPDEGQDLEG